MGDMRGLVIEVLIERGWTPFDGPTLALKVFDTFVGPKHASAWLSEVRRPNQFEVTLSGNYQSQGRNILSTSSVLIPVAATAEQIRILANDFCDYVEKNVSESYAVRLLRA